MSQMREELEGEVLSQFRAMMHRLKASSGKVLMEIDLTLPQLRTLHILAEDGPMVIGQIAQRLGVGLSTGGHLVDRLVQAGLAERTEDVEDRRRTVAQLTPKGEELYTRFLSGAQQIQALISQLGEDDLAAFLQSLQAMNRLLNRQDETPQNNNCSQTTEIVK